MAVAALNPAPQSVTVGPSAFNGTRSGVAYKLGQEIGAGGNGVVYTVARRPELVAKISKHALARHDVEKLDALVHGATPDLLDVAAWPIDCLKSGTDKVVGFIMPRILDARPLYELYSPRSRVQHFPSADFRFLVHVATNVARLFAAVHKAGFIAGDVNHSNILVRHNGTVAAVDCDSFQVGDGARFPCLVGTELFVPPELMGAALGATRRTANHDNFGLAVLVFHLLFMGRHPFAGRFIGKGDMPIERAIAENRFAYSRDVRRTQISPPPYTPPMGAVGPGIIELFERAFHPDGRNGGRPSPESWIDALEALKASLTPCKDVPWHHHLAKAKVCPWCAIEGPSRIKLFGGIIKVATAAIADLETLWAHYLSIVYPGPPRALPKPAAWKAPPAPKRDWQSIITRVHGDRLFWLAALLYFGAKFYWDEITALAPQIGPAIVSSLESVAAAPPPAEVIVLAGFGIVFGGPLVVRTLGQSIRGLARLFVKPASSTQTQASKRVPRREADEAWRRAVAAWQGQPLPPNVSALRQQIEALKPDLDALAAEREARIKACAAPASEVEQRARFLGQFRIEDAKLHNIGPARCAVLRSWGVDTAADVDDAKIAEIPGFGKNLTDKLVLWRERHEKAFAYNAASVIDPLEVQRIDRQLASRRTKLMKELRERITEIEQRITQFNNSRAALWKQVEVALNERMTVRL